jgi:hypothetical protein
VFQNRVKYPMVDGVFRTCQVSDEFKLISTTCVVIDFTTIINKLINLSYDFEDNMFHTNLQINEEVDLLCS